MGAWVIGRQEAVFTLSIIYEFALNAFWRVGFLVLSSNIDVEYNIFHSQDLTSYTIFHFMNI